MNTVLSIFLNGVCEGRCRFAQRRDHSHRRLRAGSGGEHVAKPDLHGVGQSVGHGHPLNDHRLPCASTPGLFDEFLVDRIAIHFNKLEQLHAFLISKALHSIIDSSFSFYFLIGSDGASIFLV